MEDYRVGNAPCSWGLFASNGVVRGATTGLQMLAEMAAAGYEGTELGDWGILPTEPAALRTALAAHKLALTGAYVPVNFRDPAAHADGQARAVRTAALLAAVAGSDGPWRPWLVLADDNGRDATRRNHAGRVTPELGLPADDWEIFAGGVSRVARAVHSATGLGSVFHPHCAGFVETPAEIEALMQRTDPALVGLVLDTGHYTFGTGQSEPRAAVDLLTAYGGRVRLVHLKDCEPTVAATARSGAGLAYDEAVRQGVFCELGRGCVDFPAVLAALRQRDYRGWLVVEQDVLPGLGTPAASAGRNRDYLRSIGL